MKSPSLNSLAEEYDFVRVDYDMKQDDIVTPTLTKEHFEEEDAAPEAAPEEEDEEHVAEVLFGVGVSQWWQWGLTSLKEQLALVEGEAEDSLEELAKFAKVLKHEGAKAFEVIVGEGEEEEEDTRTTNKHAL
jgi:hypothetical protein